MLSNTECGFERKEESRISLRFWPESPAECEVTIYLNRENYERRKFLSADIRRLFSTLCLKCLVLTGKWNGVFKNTGMLGLEVIAKKKLTERNFYAC